MAAQTGEPEGKDSAPPAPLRSAPDPEHSRPGGRSAARTPAILAALIVIAIVGLSLWYLVSPSRS